MTGDRFHVVAISGSLRENGMNTALLQATKTLAPDSFDIRLHRLGDVPLYNEDLEGPGLPAAVGELRAVVGAADGLIVSSPEYNRGISGVLKNALDWLSRPVFESALRGKSALALVATESMYHGMDAWVDLARLLRHLSVHVVEPDLVIHTAHEMLSLHDDGSVSLTNDFVAAALTLSLQGLETAIREEVGRIIQQVTDAYAEQLIRPRRESLRYPLQIRRADA